MDGRKGRDIPRMKKGNTLSCVIIIIIIIRNVENAIGKSKYTRVSLCERARLSQQRQRRGTDETMDGGQWQTLHAIHTHAYTHTHSQGRVSLTG